MTIGTFAASTVELIGDIPSLIAKKFAGEDIGGALAKPFKDAFDQIGKDTTAFVEEVAATIDFDFVGALGTGLLDLAEKFDLTTGAAERFAKSQKAVQDAATTTGKVLAGQAPGAVEPIPEFTKDQIEKIRKDFAKLQGSIDKTTAAQKRFAEINRVTAIALRADLSRGAEIAAFRLEAMRDLLNQVAGEADPAAKAIRDLNQQIDVINRIGGKTPELLDEVADAQRRVALATEEVLLGLPEFTSGLKTTELLTLSVRKAFQGFGDSIGSEFDLIKDVIEDTFGKALSAVEEFVTKGTFSFAEFARSVIADILKVTVKLIALQAIRAFEQRGERGGGVGGFLGGLFGDRLGPTQREVAPEVRAALGRGQSSGDALFVEIVKGAEAIPTELISGASGIEQLVNAGKAEGDKTRTNTESIFSKIGGFLQGLPGIGGLFGGGGQQRNPLGDAVGALTGVTGTGLESATAATVAGTGAIAATNKSGFGGLGDIFSAGIRGLGNIFQSGGGPGGGGGGGGSILGLVGGIIGNLIAPGIGGAIGSALGGTAGGFVGLQRGGTINTNQVGRAFLVGERGPELFRPPSTGEVVSNEALRAMAAPPEVNVSIVNVDDARSIPEAMSTREGEQSILNTIQRNRGALREIIS